MAMLYAMYLSSAISARTFCVLCYWAGLAGMPDVSQYGMHPNTASGNYKKFLDKAVGAKDFQNMLYELPVVGLRKHDLSRASHMLKVLPPHELINEELSNDPSVDMRLSEATEEKNLPAAYFSHPVVVQNPHDNVVPLSLYMDGVPYSHTDGVIGFWIINMLSGVRHLCAIVRKRVACKCGCRGWCASFPVYQWLSWSLRALAEGVFPSSRHDGSEWTAQDAPRRAKAGTPLRKCALVRLKGDWSEYCERFGFPTWKSILRPCFLCAADHESLHPVSGVSPMWLPFHTNTGTDYEEACDRCEIWITVTAENHSSIRARLKYDKRIQGSKGRALVEALPALGLRAGDRLEPCPQLPDICQLDKLTAADLPLRISFWRVSNETCCLHRNPLFDRSLGISPLSITVDTLHTLHLGAFLVYCRYVTWRLLLSGCWATTDSNTEAEMLQIAVMCMRAELFRWYRDRARSHPEENLTRLSDLTLKMLGTKAAPKLRTKAAETWGLLLFLVEMLQKYGANVGHDAQRLHEAGVALVDHMDICSGSPTQLPPAMVQRLFDTMLRHLTLIRGYDLSTPKHHLWIHMVANTIRQGNPKHVANFLNESDNKVLKGVCRGVSQITFESSVLFKMRELRQNRQANPKKRRR